MKKIILLFIFMTGFVFPAAAEQPEAPVGDVTVEAEGFGVSRDDALLKAKREAVSMGIGTVLISETEVKNFILQKDVVLTRTVGAVKEYKILKEGQPDPETWLVKIRAVVSMASVKEDLAAMKILLESMDKPRIMVVVREDGGRVAENSINDYLASKQFDVVDAATVASLMHSEKNLMRRATEGDPVAASELAAANGAEYILVGKVTKNILENELLGSAGMKSGQASISARVVNASTGRIVVSRSANSASAHISEDVAKDKAVEKAARKLMDREMFESIVATFQDMINNGIPLDVTVRNVANYRMQKAVSQALQGSEVVSINKRGFTNAQLNLTVMFKGNSDTFADTVDGRTAAGKKLVVTDVVGGRIVIDMQ